MTPKFEKGFCLSRSSICASIRAFRNRMKQRWLLFGWLLLAAPAALQAQFDYITNADGISVTITDYTGPGLGAVTIPSTLGGLPMTGIGTNAFDGSSITSVTIPDSVTSIGDSAFYDCSSLTNVTIGKSVANIGAYAFSGAYYVPAPGQEIFDSACRLTSVTFPVSVSSIGDYAFGGCTNLTTVYFQGNAPDANWDVFQIDSLTAYYLPGRIGWGPIFAGLPTALWTLSYPLILPYNPGFGAQTNAFGFNISWATNLSVVVEACTNLANPTWQPLQTNTLTNGTCYFSEPLQTNIASRYYRVRSP